MRGLRLDLLETFAAVVEKGSFSAAAEGLNLTQPAVSLQIRQLEERMGVGLVERIGKRAFATAAGREILHHAGLISDQLERLEESMRQFREGRLGRVRLGVGATALLYLMPPVLKRLHQDHPSLEIIVVTGNTGRMVERLERNDIDIAFVTLPVAHPNVTTTPVRDDPLVAVFPPRADIPEGPASPASLAARPLILFDTQGVAGWVPAVLRSVTDSWFAGAGVAIRPEMELSSVEAIKRLVEIGMACSILPEIAVIEDMQAGRLQARRLDPPLSRQFGIIERRDKPATKALGLTRDALLTLASGP